MIKCSRLIVRSGTILLFLVSLWIGAHSSAVGANRIAPHRAIYELSLDATAGDGTVAAARGKLQFEWADGCTAWLVSQRTRVQLYPNEGRMIDFGWTLNSRESKDGLTYRFFIRRTENDETVEMQSGRARLDDGKGGTARFETPEPRSLRLPPGTMFPTAHSLQLMESAQQGLLPLWRVVFDGSDEEGLFGVNAALVQAVPADTDIAFDSPLMQGQESWRMNLAYFGMDEKVAEPEFEQALRLFANGVVDELVLDYGDFALRADLETLEALPLSGC